MEESPAGQRHDAACPVFLPMNDGQDIPWLPISALAALQPLIDGKPWPVNLTAVPSAAAHCPDVASSSALTAEQLTDANESCLLTERVKSYLDSVIIYCYD